MIADIQELAPIPPLPPNSAVLVAKPGPDKVHTLMRIQYDVTDLSEDGSKLLLYLVTSALQRFKTEIKHMNKIECAAKLGKYERQKSQQGNGQ